MNYQHLFTEPENEFNLGKTIRLGETFDDFFVALHYVIRAKEKLSAYTIHTIIDLHTNKTICVLRSI